MLCVGRPLLRRATIAMIALCTTVSCGELSRPQPTPSVITFTLTPTGCTAEGFGVLLSAQFDAIVVNKTSSVAVFNFHRLRDGHAYSELESFIQQRQQRISTGADKAELALPPMTTVQAQRFVNPGQSDTFEVGLISGSYGLVCRRDSPTANVAEAVYVLGPYRVV
jgi:hypothetical protein